LAPLRRALFAIAVAMLSTVCARWSCVEGINIGPCPMKDAPIYDSEEFGMVFAPEQGVFLDMTPALTIPGHPAAAAAAIRQDAQSGPRSARECQRSAVDGDSPRRQKARRPACPEAEYEPPEPLLSSRSSECWKENITASPQADRQGSIDELAADIIRSEHTVIEDPPVEQGDGKCSANVDHGASRSNAKADSENDPAVLNTERSNDDEVGGASEEKVSLKADVTRRVARQGAGRRFSAPPKPTELKELQERSGTPPLGNRAYRTPSLELTRAASLDFVTTDFNGQPRHELLQSARRECSSWRPRPVSFSGECRLGRDESEEQSALFDRITARRGAPPQAVPAGSLSWGPRAASSLVSRPGREEAEVDATLLNSHRLEAAVSKSLVATGRDFVRQSSPLQTSEALPVARIRSFSYSEVSHPTACGSVKFAMRSSAMPLNILGPKVRRLASDPAAVGNVQQAISERLDMLISCGDVITVRDTARTQRISAIGTTGGFYGHVMLVIGKPLGYQRRMPEAEALFSMWPNIDAMYIWEVRTLECTRAESGLHESRLLCHVQAKSGQIVLLGEVNLDNEVVEFDHSPDGFEVIEIWQYPPELRASPRWDLMDMVIEEMKEHEASWSWSTAVRAFLLAQSGERLRNSADRAALFEQIQKCWTAEPICTSVAIIFWQRYICKLVESGLFSANAIDLILQWIPLKADRVLPGELCDTLRACKWTHVRRVPPWMLQQGVVRESSY